MPTERELLPRTIMVEANGLEFEVDVCGDGDRLALCLHGFPELSCSWRHQLPLLARLGYTAWAPNMRGYGRSSRPVGVGQYAMHHLVADVAGLIDAAGRSSTLLIGHDWGGAVAWDFALHPDRPLDGLVALNIPHPRLFLRRIWRYPQIRRSWYMAFFQLPWLPEWALGRRDAAAIGRAFLGSAVHPDRFPAEIVDRYRKNANQPGALTAMLNYYRAILRRPPPGAPPRAQAEILDTPTLMIWGERDTALGLELTPGTEELVSDLTLHTIADASHWVQQDAPDQVGALLEAWLDAHLPAQDAVSSGGSRRP